MIDKRARLDSLFKKIESIHQRQQVPVAIIGTITVDIITTSEKIMATIQEPQLGGSIFHVLNAWSKIIKNYPNSRNEDFDLRIYGKRCHLSDELSDKMPIWNTIFEKLLNESEYTSKLKSLIPDDGEIPVSVQVLRIDGSRESYQRDDLSDQFSWETPCLKEIESLDPGILYIGGVWRNQLHQGLDDHLKCLSEKGWIISLHPGLFDSQDPMTLSLYKAFGYIDILFATPLSFLLLAADENQDVQFLKQKARFALDYAVSKQLNLPEIPPIVVLHDGCLNIEMLVFELQTLIRIPSAAPVEKPIYTPVGLRSAFIASFIFHLCRQSELVSKESTKIVELLQDSLSNASFDAFELYKDDFNKQNIHLINKETSVWEMKPSFNTVEIIGNSEAIKSVIQDIEKVANEDIRVIITGETGVGKELVARAIHRNSQRKGKFREFNVATEFSSIDPSLRQGKLFGFGKDSGIAGIPKEGQKGVLEECDLGTIFFDELGDMPIDVQSSLLKFLDDQKFFPAFGKGQEIKINVRIITATNKILEELIKEGKFREDLYYRLNQYEIYVPTLREREEDIEALARYFASQKISNIGGDKGQCKKLFSVEALQALKVYKWPGNVRELKNTIEKLFVNVKDWASRSFTKDDVNDALYSNPRSDTKTESTATKDHRLGFVLDCLSSLFEKSKLEVQTAKDLLENFMKYSTEMKISCPFKDAIGLGMYLRKNIGQLKKHFEVEQQKKNNLWIYSFRPRDYKKT